MRGGWISAAEKAFVVGILGLRISLSELGVDHANAQRKPTTELVFQYARMMGGRPTMQEERGQGWAIRYTPARSDRRGLLGFVDREEKQNTKKVCAIYQSLSGTVFIHETAQQS